MDEDDNGVEGDIGDEDDKDDEGDNVGDDGNVLLSLINHSKVVQFISF